MYSSNINTNSQDIEKNKIRPVELAVYNTLCLFVGEGHGYGYSHGVKHSGAVLSTSCARAHYRQGRLNICPAARRAFI